MEELGEVIGRVTGVYGHQGLAERAAVFTVSELRAIGEEGEEIVRRELVKVVSGVGAEEARLRGVATHRVLELLDFGAGDLAGQVRAGCGEAVDGRGGGAGGFGGD